MPVTAQGTFTIVNALGLHARAAAQLVKLTTTFKSDIYLEKDGEEVDGKSIMGVLMLAAAKGSSVSVRAEGDDASEALKAIEGIFAEGFGEGVG